MADLQQPRELAQKHAPKSAPASSGAFFLGRSLTSPGQAALTIRFPAAPESHPGNANYDPPALRLATDLIVASGGVLQASDSGVLLASFHTFAVGVLIARRLQWALQGLADPSIAAPFAAESHDGGPRAGASQGENVRLPDGNSGVASILVESAAEAVQLDRALPVVVPGQILLSAAALVSVRDLPGFDLRAASAGWWELAWQPSAPPLSYAEDERALLGLIRDCGREDPCPSLDSASFLPAVPPAVSTVSSPGRSRWAETDPVSAPTGNRTEAKAAPTPEVRVDEAPESPAGLGSSRRLWLIIGGAVALLLLAVAVVIGMHKSPATSSGLKASPMAPTSAVSTQAAAAATPNSSGTPQATGSSKPSASHKILKPLPQPAKPPETTVGSCEFTDAGVARTLMRAEKDMHDGYLDQARTALLSIRGCGSARQHIEEDLATVQRQIAARSLTQPDN